MKIDWDIDDRVLSKEAAKQIQEDLEQVKDKHVILMTHCYASSIYSTYAASHF